MTFIPNVQGSKELAIPLIVQKTTVYVKRNIRKMENEDNIDVYIWDEYQYGKDEYIEFLQSEIIEKDLENKMALAELYEMVVENNG